MTTFYDEMADLAVELLGQGSDFGEQLTIRRPGGTYDSTSRQRGSGTPVDVQTWGTTDAASLGPTSAPASLTSVYERVLMAVPVAGAFEPGQADRVIADGGRTYIIEKTAHVIKAGISILWMAGLKTA